jgi:hypothetical protein
VVRGCKYQPAIGHIDQQNQILKQPSMDNNSPFLEFLVTIEQAF